MDVYGKWIDECEKQNEEAGDDSGSSEEDEEYELPHKKAGGSAEGSAEAAPQDQCCATSGCLASALLGFS